MKRGITIGTFDGLHLGHKAVLTTLRRECAERDLEPLVLTFDRHPLEIISPERAPKRICSIQAETRMIKEEAVNYRVLHFDEQMRRLSARLWMQKMISDYDASLLVMGYDNTFGTDGRYLSRQQYARIANESGLDIVFTEELPGISSSIIRHLIRDGKIREASQKLGRHFSIDGEVITGKRLGRQLGFPTANLLTDDKQLLPPNGVYCCYACVEGETNKYRAIVNIGIRPSVDIDGKLSIEAHLLDFNADLYGKHISLEIGQRLRDEISFSSLEALKKQLISDEKECRHLLQL